MPLVIQPRADYHLALRPERPDWAAVNAAGADALQRLSAGESTEQVAQGLASTNGLTSADAEVLVGNFADETRRIWETNGQDDYKGRGAYLRPRELRELWLHTNDRCNFTCRHCLVSCGPKGGDGLSTDELLGVIRESLDLGVETFFITGGEPLLREDMPALLAAMLENPTVHAVVLTNGALLAEPFLTAIDALDRGRLHFQVSLDASTTELNDRLRSAGAYEAATSGIRNGVGAGFDVTVATVVVEENLADLPVLLRLLPTLGTRSLHLMWQHVRERGAKERRARVADLIDRVMELKTVADEFGVTLDNFESFRAIAHGEAGVKRDLTNACWDSLAVYTDGHAYPSAALVGVEEYRGGRVLEGGLRAAWLEATVFEEYRARSIAGNGGLNGDPYAFLHGGGDPEHAHFFGRLNGGDEQDPYVPLYRAMLERSIDETIPARRALMQTRDDMPIAYQLMGQDGLGCPVTAGVTNTGPHQIDFAHSNCVLNQDVVGYSRRLVQDYYGEAAVHPRSEICCPVQGSPADLAHIPESLFERTYGCGSPVFAAGIEEGDTVIDLGSGVGVECFAASKLAGPTGRVIGIDMTTDMLEVSSAAAAEVTENLGYANVAFVRGYLESLPLPDAGADVVISNCVINLSPQKLKVFSEILRVLKPGGRMTISDIVAGEEIPEHVRYNPRLKSECIGGALTQVELVFLLSKLGFGDIRIMHHIAWREVEGVQFYSDTISAERPVGEPPAPYVVSTKPADQEPGRHEEGCLVCGSRLVYEDEAFAGRCHLCGRELRTRARCEAGHFICDKCHGGDYLRFVQSYIAQCELTDPVEIFLDMRASFPFPLHGPEHHALVPAAFLVAYRNSGGGITAAAIESAISEGAKLPGGTCAYWGGCSAALGLGVAYGTILQASPVKSRGRQIAQTVVSKILARLADFKAARCCRRESLLSLQIGAELSKEYLPVEVTAGALPACDQTSVNRECVRGLCPFSP